MDEVDLGSFMPDHTMSYDQKMALGFLFAQFPHINFFEKERDLIATSKTKKYHFKIKADILRRPRSTLNDDHTFEVIGEEKLGEGGYGITFNIIDTLTIQPEDGAVECKGYKERIVKIQTIDQAEIFNLVHNETHYARMSGNLHIKNPVYVESKNALYTIMQRKPGVNLKKQLKSRPFAFTEAAKWALELLYLLETNVHGRGLIHRDVKPSNIMIAIDDELACIIDFGLAILAKNGLENTDRKGTPYYKPYEQFKGLGENQKSDVYTMTLVILELFNLTLEQSGPDKKRASIDLTICESAKNNILELMPDLRDQFIQRLESGLRKQRDQRCTLQDLIQLFERINLFLILKPIRSVKIHKEMHEAYCMGIVLLRELNHRKLNPKNEVLEDIILIEKSANHFSDDSDAVLVFCQATGLKCLKQVNTKEELLNRLTWLANNYRHHFYKEEKLNPHKATLCSLEAYGSEHARFFNEEYRVSFAKIKREINAFAKKKYFLLDCDEIHNRANSIDLRIFFIKLRIGKLIELQRSICVSIEQFRYRQQRSELGSLQNEVSKFININMITGFDSAFQFKLLQLYYTIMDHVDECEQGHALSLPELEIVNKKTQSMLNELHLHFQHTLTVAVERLDLEIGHYLQLIHGCAKTLPSLTTNDTAPLIQRIYRLLDARKTPSRIAFMETDAQIMEYLAISKKISKNLKSQGPEQDYYVIGKLSPKKAAYYREIRVLLNQPPRLDPLDMSCLQRAIKSTIKVFIYSTSTRFNLFFARRSMSSQRLLDIRQILYILNNATNVADLKIQLSHHLENMKEKSMFDSQLVNTIGETLESFDRYNNVFKRC